MLNLRTQSAPQQKKEVTTVHLHKFVLAKSHAKPGIPGNLGSLSLRFHAAQSGEKLSQRVDFRPQARRLIDTVVVCFQELQRLLQARALLGSQVDTAACFVLMYHDPLKIKNEN